MRSVTLCPRLDEAGCHNMQILVYFFASGLLLRNIFFQVFLDKLIERMHLRDLYTPILRLLDKLWQIFKKWIFRITTQYFINELFCLVGLLEDALNSSWLHRLSLRGWRNIFGFFYRLRKYGTTWLHSHGFTKMSVHYTWPLSRMPFSRCKLFVNISIAFNTSRREMVIVQCSFSFCSFRLALALATYFVVLFVAVQACNSFCIRKAQRIMWRSRNSIAGLIHQERQLLCPLLHFLECWSHGFSYLLLNALLKGKPHALFHLLDNVSHPSLHLFFAARCSIFSQTSETEGRSFRLHSLHCLR
mmetsp:Transcript_5591/g.8740  ORF Transcript_5591/g.8740 Transcript_5591/m.8740 type:complete len:302 (-) Transcript_5591:250-1155(-)